MMLMLRNSPPSALYGTVMLPFSKSISNRLLMLKEFCGNAFSIKNISDADDTVLLKQLIDSYRTQRSLDAGNAGTVLRFMAVLLATTEGEWQLGCSDRMSQRPVAPLVDALRQLGAEVSYTGSDGYPPLLISGKKLQGGKVLTDAGISSQFVSALLLAAPFMPSGMQIGLSGGISSAPYIDMTIALLKTFGAGISREDNVIRVLPGLAAAGEITVERDWSAASYWYCAAALSAQAAIRLPGLSLKSLQGDSVLADIFTHLGIVTSEEGDGILITKTDAPDASFTCDLKNYPDLFPALAVTCAALGINAKLSGLHNLRIKESDRLAAVAEGLRRCGAEPAVTENHEMIIRGGNALNTENVLINSYDDHRIAMAFSQLVWKYGRIDIDNISVCSKSYPGFPDDMVRIGDLQLAGSR